MSNPPSSEPPAPQNEQTKAPEGNGQKKKRLICQKCLRPTPRACICDALPQSRLSLERSRVIVLEHPHESKRKNRSIPLLALCIKDNDILIASGRRLGDKVSPTVMSHLRDPKQHSLLLYPGPDAVSLEEGLRKIREREKEDDSVGPVVNIVALDATWKFVREMDRENIREGHYPPHMIRIVLKPSDFKETSRPNDFVPHRFEIRAPPSPDHLSTAECIAWVLSRIEQDSTLYTTLMRPLDLMVQKWQSFSTKRDRDEENNDPGPRKLGSKKRKLVPIPSLPAGNDGM